MTSLSKIIRALVMSVLASVVYAVVVTLFMAAIVGFMWVTTHALGAFWGLFVFIFLLVFTFTMPYSWRIMR